MVTMTIGDIRMAFDDKGMFDTKAYLKNFEETVLIPRLNIHFKQVEEIEVEEVEADEKEYKCKKCDFTCDSKGLLLAHYREHKKDGDS